MRSVVLSLALLTGLWLPPLAAVASPTVRVGPMPTSDRRFPFVVEGPAFTGTPLAVTHARLPGVTIVLGQADTGSARQAAALALRLGQWTESAAERPLVRMATEMTPEDLARDHLIVLGQENILAERLKGRLPEDLGKRGPELWVLEDAFAPGKHVLLVAGRDAHERTAAADYLANERLVFKAGAYDGFFAFVRLRGYLEKGNLLAAADLLGDPRQLRGCAKPVMLMGPKLAGMPPEVGELARRRNQLVFGGIREAVAQGDGKKAIGLWQQTMETCYACHQGRGGPRVRQYAPLEVPHRSHQAIAERAGLSCTTCHQGPTEAAGYDARR